MARTPSTMLDLGTAAADFSLPEPSTGQTVSLSDFNGKPLLIVFSCNHCPFVLHILESFTEFATEYSAKGLSVVMINANDIAHYPDDSPEKMIDLVSRYKIGFHYLYDESQQVAQAYNAACTPDLYLFGADHKLVYRGQYDAARPGNDIEVTGNDLREATDALLAGDEISNRQHPSMGCNIKWKAGNEPEYF